MPKLVTLFSCGDSGYFDYMTPKFALSLSFDGIVLFEGTGVDQTRLGSADLASEPLAEALDALRQLAEERAPEGAVCDLVIPDDQIKYLVIDTPGQDTDARRIAARDALDGATPYAVDDLVFDICESGGQTSIAAVAQETLQRRY